MFQALSYPGQFASALAVLLLCMGSGSARAQQSLSLPEAERIALERDAVLRQLGAESEGMRERAIAEGQLMDPKLRFGAVNLPVDSLSLDDEEMSMLELGMSQEFLPGDTRRLTRLQMEHGANATEATAADRRRQVQREVRRIWTELAYLDAARALVREQIGWVEQMRSAARARYAAGEGRQLELLQAGLDAAMLREQLLDLDRDEAMYRAQLARWVGPDDAQRAAVSGLPPRGTLETLAVLEERLAKHPTQQDFEERLRAADTAVELAEQRYKPGWMLDLSYGYRDGEDMDGESRTDMVTAMVSMDMPLFRRQRKDREVAAARAEARGLHEMHLDHQREMQAMLAEAWSRASRTGELEALYERDLLPLASQTVEAALLAYRSNRAMVDEVVMARRVALDTNLKALRLAADRVQARYDIDYLAGEQP
jgi:outer membrane protein TolC